PKFQAWVATPAFNIEKFLSHQNTSQGKVFLLPFRGGLTRIIHEAFWLQGTIRPTDPSASLRVLSLSTDFDYGFFKTPLRVGLEQGMKHRLEICMKANSFLADADSRIPRIRE
ncbi:MAG: hypothetical protein JSV14_14795, partial [Deltaproteobacteria bacterium]